MAPWLWRWEWHWETVPSIETARILVALGEHADAADMAGKLIQAADDQADVYNAACIFARCVPLAERDKERAQNYADRAMAALRQAVQNGYKDCAHMKKDTDLDPLRSHPEFQKLLKELEAKAKQDGK
jgi:hypothetical protein